MKDNKEKMKALARSTKEKSQSSNLKRKETKSTLRKKLIQNKKSKAFQEGTRVESSKQPMPSSTLVICRLVRVKKLRM